MLRHSPLIYFIKFYKADMILYFCTRGAILFQL